MDFKEKIEIRAKKLSNDLKVVNDKYNEILKEEDLKWYAFLKRPFGAGEVSEINNFEYFMQNMDDMQKKFSQRVLTIKTTEELEEFNKLTKNFFEAKQIVEEQKAKRVTIDKVENDKKVTSAKLLYEALGDIKQIICESIQEIDAELCDLQIELANTLYTNSKYAELQGRIEEIKNNKNPYIGHLKLIEEMEKTYYLINMGDITNYGISEEYIELYGFLAKQLNNYGKSKNEPLMIESYDIDFSYIEPEKQDIAVDYDDVIDTIADKNINENVAVELQEIEENEISEVSLKEEKEITEFHEVEENSELPEVGENVVPELPEMDEVELAEPVELDDEITNENINDADVKTEISDTVIDMDELDKLSEQTKDEENEGLEQEESKEEAEVVTPKNIKRRPSKVKKVFVALSGVGVSAGSFAFGPAGPGVLMTTASISKVAVKRGLKKNEERENRLNELLSHMEFYEKEIKSDISNEEKEDIKVKFKDAINEAKAIEDRLRPDLSSEKYNGPKITKETFKGPEKVKAIVDVKDNLKAKVNKLKAYLGSNDGLKDINLFLNAVLISSVGFCLHEGIISLINLNNTNTPVDGIAGRILDNPDAVRFLEKVDRMRR